MLVDDLVKKIELIVGAAHAERVIYFRYQDLEGAETSRFIELIRLEGGTVVGWCLHREAIRRFRLVAMTDLAAGPEYHDVVIPLPDPAENLSLAELAAYDPHE